MKKFVGTISENKIEYGHNGLFKTMTGFQFMIGDFKDHRRIKREKRRAYDLEHHQQNAYQTRRKGRAIDFEFDAEVKP